MRILAGLVAMLLPLLAVDVRAAADFQVQSAIVHVRDGNLELSARINYPLNDDVIRALDEGATINFDLQAVVEKKRRYWLDDTTVDVILHRELSWNAVTERYVLIDFGRGEQDSFTELKDALAAVGMVNGWVVARQARFDRQAGYEVRVRAGYRRGRLPDALRALAFWSNGWSRTSEWKTWLLPH